MLEYTCIAAFRIQLESLNFMQARDLPKTIVAAYHLIPYFIFNAQEGLSLSLSVSIYLSVSESLASADGFFIIVMASLPLFQFCLCISVHAMLLASAGQSESAWCLITYVKMKNISL